MGDIFNKMAAERARAMVAGQNPVGWKINGAALDALNREMGQELDPGKSVQTQPLFGLPVIVDSEDSSGEPRFTLVEYKLKEETRQ